MRVPGAAAGDGRHPAQPVRTASGPDAARLAGKRRGAALPGTDGSQPLPYENAPRAGTVTRPLRRTTARRSPYTGLAPCAPAGPRAVSRPAAVSARARRRGALMSRR